jgi:hypothetical protein
VELPGLARTRLAATVFTIAVTAIAAAPARAAGPATVPGTPELVTSQTTPPAGFRLTANQVQRIAAAIPHIRATVHDHKGAYPAEYTKGPGLWQVSWFTPAGKEIAQVYVDDATGKVTQSWTGFQVAWSMARGYPGAFGRRVNAWYVWLPLCLLFVAPFMPWRKGPDGRRRWSLLHIDLLVLLAFSVSLAFFNHANLGLSVPLVYPCLLYLLVRMLALAFGRGRPRTPLELTVPVSWLAIALIFLVGFRIGLNVTNSNVIDVGYAGVIGAHKLVQGQNLYGNWPLDNASGDTYGPVNYYAYVPAYALFGWSGSWDDLPAAHMAAVAFDLLTLLGLYLLGRRVRGPTLGIVLAYSWASYPFALFVLESNSNDALVAALLVLTLVVISSPPIRGVAAALAGLTKFAPLALGPLFMRGTEERPRPRSLLTYALAYGATIVVAMLPVLLSDNVHAFWHDSIAYQASRAAPFSVWGLWGGLGFLQHVVQGLAVALAITVAFVPRRRTVVEVSALAAAVLLALDLGVTYWFYLYIVWFFPLVMFALLASHPSKIALRSPHAATGLVPHAAPGPPTHASVAPAS